MKGISTSRSPQKGDELRVFGEGVEMQFDDGDKAGDVDLDFTMTGCGSGADALEDLFEESLEG